VVDVRFLEEGVTSTHNVHSQRQTKHHRELKTSEHGRCQLTFRAHTRHGLRSSRLSPSCTRVRCAEVAAIEKLFFCLLTTRELFFDAAFLASSRRGSGENKIFSKVERELSTRRQNVSICEALFSATTLNDAGPSLLLHPSA
jgi:hypothetical protein